MRESHNGFASYPGSGPQLRASIRSTRPSHKRRYLSHPPTRPTPRPRFSCSRVLLESRSRRLSPWITVSLSLSLLLLLSFSFAFKWRAIELLRVDKRETQFKLRLLAVVTTVIITLAFHGDSRAHVHAAETRRYVASRSKFTQRSILRDISSSIVRDAD